MIKNCIACGSTEHTIKNEVHFGYDYKAKKWTDAGLESYTRRQVQIGLAK